MTGSLYFYMLNGGDNTISSLHQTIIRRRDYVEEYKKLTYEQYAKEHIVIDCTYYHLDKDESVYDQNYMSSYRPDGKLTGLKYSKIHNLAVLFSQNATPHALNSSEQGLNFMDQQTSIVIDTVCGLKPHPGDRVIFKISNDYSTWVVSNVTKSGTFDITYYQCQLKQEMFNYNFETENVLTQEYQYDEFTKKIYSVFDAENYERNITRLNKVIDYLNSDDNYHDNIGYHFYNSLAFPQLETIVATHDKISPPLKILLNEGFDVEIPLNSIFILWTMITKFDNAHKIMNKISTVSKDSVVNPKVNLWKGYSEALVSKSGTPVGKLFYGNKAKEFNAATNFLLDCQKEDKYDTSLIRQYPNSSICNLADEIAEYNYSGNPMVYPDSMFATNLFEAMVEYCQINKELLDIENHKVILE